MANTFEAIYEMTNRECAIFKSEEFGNVRIVEIEGAPWFVGKDVAAALGYSNSREALADHVDDDDKRVRKVHTKRGSQGLTIINESGLYTLILGSKLPRAQEFKRWVINEALPSVRKAIANMVAEREQHIADEINDAKRELNDTQSKLRRLQSLLIIAENPEAVFGFINICVRSYAGTMHTPLGYAWAEYYDRLVKRIGVDLRTRRKPYIRQLTQHEVIDALAVAKEMPTKGITTLVDSEMIDALKLIADAIQEIVET